MKPICLLDLGTLNVTIYYSYKLVYFLLIKEKLNNCYCM